MVAVKYLVYLGCGYNVKKHLLQFQLFIYVEDFNGAKIFLIQIASDRLKSDKTVYKVQAIFWPSRKV